MCSLGVEDGNPEEIEISNISKAIDGADQSLLVEATEIDSDSQKLMGTFQSLSSHCPNVKTVIYTS